MRTVTAAAMVLCLFFAAPALLQAQTAATARVAGTVSDPTGAVVPNARVELLNPSTNIALTQTTDPVGQYVFPSVAPGTYTITVTRQGFRTASVPKFNVEVAKSYTIDIALELGAVEQVVEVEAAPAMELQTADATVGAVIGGEQLTRLPSFDRQAATLLLLQPVVTPGFNVDSGNITGGQVAGARSDQTTFRLDGGDATNNTEGTGGYATVMWSGIPLPVIPVPVESIEEFRVSTTNPNATFGRSMGAQVIMVTKRGTNSIHGSAYWYHQNDNLSANFWDLNRTGQKKPEEKDNRFGFSLGGPLVKDKTFLYGHYEGRRRRIAETITRLVPTNTLRQGILRFRDSTGGVVSYPLAASTLCGPTNTAACDPRGLGLSPVVQSLWNFLPPGNDPSLGDGLNTIGFRGSADTPINSDFFVVRLDQQITDKWSFLSSFRYSRLESPNLNQIDIGGLLSGQLGKAVPVGSSPVQPRYLVWGVDGQISPRLSNQFRFSWTRNWWEWQRAGVFPQVPGTSGALQLAGEPGLVDEPINIDTQNARSRVWNEKDINIRNDTTWLVGRHTFQFGGSFLNQDVFHRRDDKVVGSLSSLVYFLDADQGITVLAANRPPTCGGAITTNCLSSGDISRWDSLYTGALGMVDRATIMLTRDGSFNNNPLGTPVSANSTIRSYEFYAQDIWRVTPSWTVSYGLTYQVQVPPVESDGKQVIMINRGTGEPVFADDYFRQRQEAALSGQIFNPELAFTPIRSSGRKYVYDIDWNNLGPRAAAAWSPSFTEGFWGRLFGDRQTVLRGGYSLTYDRLNGVGLVMTPILGVGFGQTLACVGPTLTGVCATSTDPSTAFRIGVDGSTVPLPPAPPGTIPLSVGSPFGEILSFSIDPGLKPGEAHSLDFTIQRELPGNTLLEVGYVGRLGRNLKQSVDVTAVPFFQLDPASGQSFAQAFDAVAAQLRAGVAATAVTTQSWFENQVGAGMTQTLASNFTTEFVNGDVWSLFLFGINSSAPQPFTNDQVLINLMTVDGGRSNYHAGFIRLQKRMSHGLTFAVNYTFSKALDQFGLNQEYIDSNLSPFDFDLDYGPARFDRRHALNVHWFYELPFGSGRHFSTGSRADKILGGWWTAGIFTASSGLPLCVLQSFETFGGGAFGTGCAPARGSLNLGNNSAHRGVTGTTAGTTGDVNLFADPDAAFNSFRQVLLSQEGRHGFGVLRGLPRWNVDFSLGKRTKVTETVGIVFSFDFLNMFNHVEFSDPDLLEDTLNLTNPGGFGVIDSQFNQPRRIQFGFRVEF